MGTVSALSARAYTATLHVIADKVKGGGSAPPPSLPGWADFFHHDGMYARKWQLPLCVYSVD